MPRVSREDRYRACWEAVQRRVCAVCLESADDGSCRLAKDRACAIEHNLPRLVDTLISLKSGGTDAHMAALESEICGTCREQEADGQCRLREDGQCALSIYWPLVVDAIDRVV